MDKITTQNAPAAIGPYSQAVVSGGFVFTSGQLGIDPATGVLADTIEAQTEQIMKNLTAVLAAAGSSAEKVVKTTCFLADMDDFYAGTAVQTDGSSVVLPGIATLNNAKVDKIGKASCRERV